MYARVGVSSRDKGAKCQLVIITGNREMLPAYALAGCKHRQTFVESEMRESA